VIHEDDLPNVRQALEKYHSDQNVLGLVLRVIHFKGDYWSVDPWMYRKATRVIRNFRGVRSTTDCCDFRTAENAQMLKSGSQGRLVEGRVFHYGWVKDSDVLRLKRIYQRSRFSEGKFTEQEIEERSAIEASYPTYSFLKEFKGSHPKVMANRIKQASRLRPRKNRWLNLKFYREILKHGFKG